MVYFCPLRFVLIQANSADLDEMQHDAAFHVGLHYLQKYLFRDQILDLYHLLKIASGYLSHLLKMLINLPFH